MHALVQEDIRTLLGLPVTPPTPTSTVVSQKTGLRPVDADACQWTGAPGSSAAARRDDSQGRVDENAGRRSQQPLVQPEQSGGVARRVLQGRMANDDVAFDAARGAAPKQARRAVLQWLV